ncbi:hypothetical protein A4X09_0g5592 [Tilletia walkeri]|uniref:ARM repeat-containing protein n=1 Tax=Tilletia walkeri TaxID=117179 RepID=A0A8X7N739_9BASI|nr:hypothetical protein A4X09_0g5592 [Tilletia walkeri]
MSSDAALNSAPGQTFEVTEKTTSPGETENRLGDLSLGEAAGQRARSPSLASSRRSFDRSKSPSNATGLSSPTERSQQSLGSAVPGGAQKRSHSPQAASPFSFPSTSSASSTPVGTPTLPSASLPSFSTGGGTPGRSNSISGASSSDPFNFAGSPSLSNRPLEAAKHQHHRSRSINMGGFSPVMKGGKLINFGSGPISISGGGEGGSSGEGSSSNPGSPLSSSPANSTGLGPGFDPSALGPGFAIGSSTPRAPSPLQQSHTAVSSHLMEFESSNNLGVSGSSTSPTIPAAFSSSPSGQSISHNHRDSRTIDFATSAKGWESPLFPPTNLPLPIPIGQHSLSSLRAAAAASERARSPKPLSLGEAHNTSTGVTGASSLSPDHAAQNGSASSASTHHNGPARKPSGSFAKHGTVELAHDSILASPKFKNVPLTSLSPSSPPKAAVASSGPGHVPGISRPVSPRINAWPSSSNGISPGSSPSSSSFHYGSSPGSRLHRPASPSIRLEHSDGRGRTPSPSRVRDGSGISRGASLSPPLDSDAQNMRMRPVSPSSWDSSWPEVSGGSRSVPIGLSSSPHNHAGGVRLERNFSSGSGSSGGSPGTSPVASSNVFANSSTGLGIAPGAWKFPSSPRSGAKKMLSRTSRSGRDSGSSASRSRSQSPSQPLGQSDRPKNADRDSEGSRRSPSSPVTLQSSGEGSGSAHVSPHDLLYARNRSLSSSSSSSGHSSEGSNGVEEPSQKYRPSKRSAHGRTVSIDSAGRPSPSSSGKHARKASDPIPSVLKDPPSAMRIAHGTAKTEVDARQALSESTKGKAGAAGGLIADEVDAFSDQLPPPAIPARAHLEGSSGMAVDEADPLSRPVTSSSHLSHSPMPSVGGHTPTYSLLVRPTPVDARLLPPFGASPMARTGSGNTPSNVLGLGPESLTGGLHSPHSPFNIQSPMSPRLGASPLPVSERTLLGLRSRSPSPAAMIVPSPFDPLRRQSPSPSPLASTLEALNGESPPKMRSFIGMPPRSGYNLSDDPDDVGSEGDDGTASSASSTDGREGSTGGDDEDTMDEKEDDDEDGEERTIRADSDSGRSQDDEQDLQLATSGRRELRGLPSDISRSTLFTRRQNTSSSSTDGDVEDNRDGHEDGQADGSDGREQRRGMRESRAPSPPTETVESTSRPPLYAPKPSLTRSNVVAPPPELDDDDQAGSRAGRMTSAFDLFHGDDPESQLDESTGWGAPLSRQISNGTRELSMATQDEDEDADTTVSKDGDADWMPPSSQSMNSDQEDPTSESEEALTTLERIFLFAKSEMTYHRILVSQCLAEWILDVKLSDAVEFIIPLLNGLSTDEREVCENFSPELHRIMWFFFRNCPLKQVEEAREKDQAETPNGSAHMKGSAEETAIRPHLDVGTFTPLLCALLLNTNSDIARSTQNAIVQFCSRLHRDSEGILLSEDGSWAPELTERCEGDHTFLITSTVNRDGKDISYEPYFFGPEARRRVEEEILQNVAIAISSQNAFQPLPEGRTSSEANGNAAEHSGGGSAEMSGMNSQESKGDDAGTSQDTSISDPGEISRDDSSWDPESQMDSRMEDVWRSDGNLFDASSPQMGPYTNGEFDEEAAVARMAGVTMLAALAAENILHVDIITEKFVPQMVGLEKDPAFFVRKEVAVSLGILAKAVTNEVVIKENLLPTLDTYLNDKIWHVRQAACLSMPAVLSKTDDETQRSRAVAYLRLLAVDISRNVRSAALEIIGELVFLFHEKEGGVPEELIRFFLNEPLDGPDEEMAGTGKANDDSNSQSKFELSNVTSEYGFGDPLQMNSDAAWGGGMFGQSDVHERAVVTAFNFPAVVVTMGAQHWARLQPLHTKLSQDDAVKVRRSLAASLHEIAKIIGSEASQAHLLPIFENFLQDYENEIKTAVLDNVDVFLAQLPQESALTALRSMQERWIHHFGRDWRLRERLTQHISTMADTFLLSDEDANLIALMQLAIADPVSAVRDAGIQSIAKIYTIFSEHDQAAADGFLALVDELGNSTSYRIRVASLMAIEALVNGSIQRAAIETILLERLVAAADDDVIDVRIVLARCVAAMCQKDELYGLPQSRSPVLLELIAKLARDISAEVRLPIQTFLSEEEANAAEQEAQEKIAHAPKSSTRTLVLGPKEGGPHRETRMSTFSVTSMDQSSDPDVDVDVDEELQAFAMDEDVSEQQQQQEEEPSSGQRSQLSSMENQFGSAAEGGEMIESGTGDVSRLDDDGNGGEEGGHHMRESDSDGTTQVLP